MHKTNSLSHSLRQIFREGTKKNVLITGRPKIIRFLLIPNSDIQFTPRRENKGKREKKIDCIKTQPPIYSAHDIYTRTEKHYTFLGQIFHA